jgi:hypothetical protein
VLPFTARAKVGKADGIFQSKYGDSTYDLLSISDELRIYRRCEDFGELQFKVKGVYIS